MADKIDGKESEAELVKSVVIQELPADVRQSVRRGKASMAIVLRGLKLKMLELQSELDKLVPEIRHREQAMAAAMAKFGKGFDVDSIDGVKEIRAGFKRMGLDPRIHAVEAQLQRPSTGTVRGQTPAIVTLSLSLDTKDRHGWSDRHSLTLSVPVPAPESLVSESDTIVKLWDNHRALLTQLASIRRDIEITDDLGDAVAGAEAVAQLSVEDQAAVANYISGFTKHLSSAGKAAVGKKPTEIRRQLVAAAQGL